MSAIVQSASASIIDGPTLGAGKSQIQLLLGEDAYDGNVQFTVSVGGVQIGGTQTITAIQSDNQAESFTLNGAWAAGSSVAIDFLNAAGDGTAITNGHERNLYVDGVSANGVIASDTVSTLYWSGTSYYATQPSLRASDFVQSLGVVTHLQDYNTSYYDENMVVASLKYLGIKLVRDGGSSDDPSTLDRDEVLLEAGNRLDFASNIAFGIGTSINNLEILNAAYPGQVVATEGVNEVSDSFNYGGLTGEDAANLWQQQLYAAVHGDPALANVAVLNYTVANIYDPNSFTQYGNISSEADEGNVHIYGFNGISSYTETLLPRMLAGTPNDTSFAVTELGYDTMSNGDDVSAKYLLDSVFDLKQAGASMVFIYELLDENADPDLTDTEQHFGLFNSDGTPKESATAFHNLTAILADRGQTPPALPRAN